MKKIVALEFFRVPDRGGDTRARFVPSSFREEHNPVAAMAQFLAWVSPIAARLLSPGSKAAAARITLNDENKQLNFSEATLPVTKKAAPVTAAPRARVPIHVGSTRIVNGKPPLKNVLPKKREGMATSMKPKPKPKPTASIKKASLIKVSIDQ